MRDFLTHTSGRIATIATGLMVLVAGYVAFTAGPHVLVIRAVTPIAGAAAFIVAVGLSLERFPALTFGLLLGLPLLGGLYYVTLVEIPGRGGAIGGVLIALGAALTLFGLISPRVLSGGSAKSASAAG